VVSIFLQAALGFNSDDPVQFAHLMLITVGVTTLVWIAATFATAPEPKDKLLAFYRKVRPPGPGWRVIARLARTCRSPTISVGTYWTGSAAAF